MTTPNADPAWLAARCGLPGDTTAVNHAAQVAQFLAAHGITCVYAGNRAWTVASTSSATVTPFFWVDPANIAGGFGWLPDYDVDQPVILPGGVTAIGRVEVAVQAFGAGADLQVTLYPDSAGNPNLASPLASATIPAAHLLALSAAGSLASAGPLATSRSNTTLPGNTASAAWTQPAVSINGAGTFATPVTSGNWTLFLGGFDATAGAATAMVASVQYLGGGAVSGAIPQPALPQAAWYSAASATTDAIVVAGGTNQASAHFASVWTAPWDPAAGTLGAWSAQQSLPAASVNAAAAAWNDTIYIAGGSTDGTNANAVATLWHATEQNGQVTAWSAGPPLPAPVIKPYLAVVGDWLIAAGGADTSGTALTATWYAAIGGDGTPGPWQPGPQLPAPAYAFAPSWNLIATDSAVIIISGTTTGGASSFCTQVLAVSPDGPAPEWQLLDYTLGAYGTFPAAAYQSGGDGEWEIFGFFPTGYTSATLLPVPFISVPLPASGLTPGNTYHIVFRQSGGDALNNYVQLGELTAATPPAPWLYSARGSGGPWSSHASHAIAVSVYDQAPGGPVLHLHEDAGAKVTTLVNASASGYLTGALEATMLPPPPVVPGRVGAYLDGASLGTSGWTASLAAWESITGIPLPVSRWYAGTTYTVGTTLSQMISAGTRICIDFAPPFSPVSSGDRTSIVSMLTTMLGSGADVRVSLWHEPALNGLTNSQYTAMVQYYGPAIQALGIPVWAVFSGSDAIEANGYYPGDGFTDGIAADDYATGTASLDNCAAMASGHGLPLGLWETNAAFDLGISPSPVTGVTQAQGTAFFAYVQSLFSARLAAGLPNGDIILFSAGAGGATGTGNFLGPWNSDAAGLETTIAHWVNSGNCAIARTTAQAHSGAASLSLTSAASGSMSARPENIAGSTTYALAVTPGQPVAASAWFRAAASARNVHVDVTWYSAALANLSTSNGTAVADTTSGWTFASFSGTAPASAAWAVAHVQVDSTGAASEVHYVDDVQIALLPASTDHTAPVQFPWDWRIPLWQAIHDALDGVAPAVASPGGLLASPGLIASVTQVTYGVTGLPSGTVQLA